jgi:hypothetical protein
MSRSRLGSWVLACLAVPLLTVPVHAQAVPRAADPEGGSEDETLGPSSAPSRSREVVLLVASERLNHALRAALAPWGMRVERVVRANPMPTLPGTALHASALARELDAQVLVWLSSNEDGAALWLYEASKDTITVRPFPDKPLDQALSAALALSVKTWLRSSDLKASRSATPEAPDRSVPVPAEAEEVDEVDDVGDRDMDDVIAAPETPQSPEESQPALRVAPVRWQVLIHAAARHGAIQPAAFETRYGVDVRLSPWQSDARATTSWLGVRVELGQPQDIGNSRFSGVYSEWGGGLSAGIAHRLGELVNVALHLGATLHRGSVTGTLLVDSTPAERGNWGAGAQVRPELELSFGHFGIVMQPTLGVALWKGLYTADDLEVLEPGPLWWTLGGAARVDLF